MPAAVLETIHSELLDYRGTGLSVLSMSHRSPEFGEILDGCRAALRRVLRVPPSFEILLTHGGGHGQFTAVPLNLCAAPDRPADYVVTGSWSQAAADEAAPFARVAVAARGTADGLPPREAWVVREDQGRTGVLQRVFNLMFRR